jgi:hypothetical protein
MIGNGFLAIWSDLSPEDETDWAHWMTREHSSERVGIDGFLGCRIFRATSAAANRYVILYDLETPDVVGGPEYLARLNAPTPWTQRTMPRLRNFVRGGGRVAARSGVGGGGKAAVLRLQRDLDHADGLVKEIAAADRIIAAHAFETDAAQTSVPTREKGMRSGDATFVGLLVVEGLDERAVRGALWQLRRALPEATIEDLESQTLYNVCFSLQRQ